MWALAIVVNRNIVTIEPQGMRLFCCDVDNNGKLATAAYKNYPSRYSQIVRDLPVEVLNAETWYIIFNGQDHYWPAVHTSPVPVTADIEREQLVLDIHKRKREPAASIGPLRRSVRLKVDL